MKLAKQTAFETARLPLKVPSLSGSRSDASVVVKSRALALADGFGFDIVGSVLSHPVRMRRMKAKKAFIKLSAER